MRLRARWLTAVLLLCGAWGQAAFTIRTVTHAGRRYVYIRDVAAYYGFTVKRTGDTVQLQRDGSELRLRLERREASCGGVRIHLSFAPLELDGVELMSERDFSLLLDPIRRGWALPDHTVKRVVLDPGHGGKDHGGEGRGLSEKALNLAVAEQVKKILEAKGYEVYLTRTDNDTDVSLSRRARLCGRWHGDVFVSIHGNKADSRKVSGIESFVLSPADTPSTASSHVSRSRSTGNGFDALSARLGYELQRHLLAATGAADRGLKHARFQVLREAPCPSALVETGFLSHRGEEGKLRRAAYRYRLAVGIANGIIAFHRALVIGRNRRLAATR